MHREDFDVGAGQVWVLSRSEDWGAVSRSLKRLVPKPMREAFQSFPATFVEQAAGVRHQSLRRFLEACGRGKCRLRLYETEDFGRMALLELSLVGASQPLLLDFRTSETRTRRYPPSAPARELPRVVPPALAAVYEACGGIQHQLGASGSLIPPDALRPLPSCWQADTLEAIVIEPPTQEQTQDTMAEMMGQLQAELERSGQSEVAKELAGLNMATMADQVNQALSATSASGESPFTLERWLEDCPGAPSAERVATMFPFYESSGDYLCFEPDGRATWIGWESGGVMPFGTVDDAVAAYFDSVMTDGLFSSLFLPQP